MPERSREPTPLESALTPAAREWFTQYACEKWGSLYGSLSGWRGRMKMFADRSKTNFDDRIADVDPLQALYKIFARQNDTLGVVNGFADFAYAQAVEDLFGQSPWFMAQPVGAADQQLADVTTKHGAWKFDHSNMLGQLKRTLRTAIDIGTAFPKATWRREEEVYEDLQQVAVDSRTGTPLNVAGEHVTDPSLLVPMVPESEDAPMILTHTDDESIQLPAENLSWKKMAVTVKHVVFDNVETSCISYKDIAFDPTALSFDLIHTDVFQRFDIGLLDAIQQFGLSQDDYENALGSLRAPIGAREPGEQREEGRPEEQETTEDGKKLNPAIQLVEGYMRCDPFGTGTPVRIYCILAPSLNMMLFCDYLQRITPEGRLPVFPIRCYQEENRICGIGYQEQYKYAGDSIDEQYSSMKYRNRRAANPHTGIDFSALKMDKEDFEESSDPEKPWELLEGKKMEDAISFAKMPDSNARTQELMDMDIQLVQMRSGISSAAQGEVGNLPSTRTATGVNALLSRAALLLKAPIKDMRSDVRQFLRYAFQLLHGNMSQDETFAWGEGNDAQILTMSAEDARGMHFDIKLQISQTLLEERLNNAQTAIGVATSYTQLPEIEKTSLRPLFIQALKALGFESADELVRQAIADPAMFIQTLPEDLQAMLPDAAALMQQIVAEQQQTETTSKTS